MLNMRETPMKYKLLGRSGLKVSELCLGTMTFGEDWGKEFGSNKKDSKKVFDAFVEAGGNFFDTANLYTKGGSETFLGEFIQKGRDQYVVATKYSLSTNPENPNASGNHRKNMMQSLNESLKRLKTDYIDLYWIHAWDQMTPSDEVMRALDDMVRAGKILYIGSSDTPAWVVSQCNTMADLRGWTPFAALQLEYSLVERTIEREFFPMSKALDLAIVAWSPLGMGVLTGKYSNGMPKNTRFTGNLGAIGEYYITERNLKIANAAVKVAKEIGKTASQVSLAWLRQKAHNIIPIIGAKNIQHLTDNLGSLKVELSDEQMKKLDAASKIDLGFPHDFLSREYMRQNVYGNYYELIENHRS